MERLTERFDDGEAFCENPFVIENVGVNEVIYTGKLVERLADYEDREEKR